MFLGEGEIKQGHITEVSVALCTAYDSILIAKVWRRWALNKVDEIQYIVQSARSAIAVEVLWYALLGNTNA